MENNEKYLISTSNWFLAPDGREYRAVWGTVKILSATSTLGITPNRNSSNWYVMVGGNGKEAIVAGCQVLYAVRCEAKPYTEEIHDYHVGSEKTFSYKRPTKIYIAE